MGDTFPESESVIFKPWTRSLTSSTRIKVAMASYTSVILGKLTNDNRLASTTMTTPRMAELETVNRATVRKRVLMRVILSRKYRPNR